MKRIFYAIAAILALGALASCESQPKNPGDFNKECQLTVAGPVVSLVTGKTYDLKVARTADTTYRYTYVVRDTLLDENNKPVIGPDGKPVTEDDTVYVYSKITAKLVELEPLYLPGQADTFSVEITSNARWLAAQPQAKGTDVQWYFNYGSTTTGGGNSWLQFRTIRNRNNVRANVMMQQVITSDSSVMYRIPILQYGQKDQPADY